MACSNHLALRPAPRVAPGPGELEIRVVATGLNFRDVLNALGMYPGDPGSARERVCRRRHRGWRRRAGVRTWGRSRDDDRPELRDLRRIAGSAHRAQTVEPDVRRGRNHSSHVSHCRLRAHGTRPHQGGRPRADSRGDWRRWDGSPAGCAPRRRRDLRHRRHACEACARASPRCSPRRRTRVRLPSSRSSSARQDDAGIDIVSNSLAGEFIPASLGLLRSGGRFVEIGKTDIWDAAAVANAFPDVEYHALYLGEVTAAQPLIMRARLQRVMEDLSTGIADAAAADCLSDRAGARGLPVDGPGTPHWKNRHHPTIHYRRCEPTLRI